MRVLLLRTRWPLLIDFEKVLQLQKVEREHSMHCSVFIIQYVLAAFHQNDQVGPFHPDLIDPDLVDLVDLLHFQAMKWVPVLLLHHHPEEGNKIKTREKAIEIYSRLLHNVLTYELHVHKMTVT